MSDLCLKIIVTISFNTTVVRDDESAESLTFIIVTNRSVDTPFTVQVCTEDLDGADDMGLGVATGT